MPLVLGGVAIDHPRGLAGHSDGDVIAHALTDALLGAAGLGDIGALFPSSDERYRGADSLLLLADAYARVQEAGYTLVNADCVLIGQEPRIAGHREEMARGSPERSLRRTARSVSARRRRTSSASPGAARASLRRRWHCCGAARPEHAATARRALALSHIRLGSSTRPSLFTATVPTGGARAPWGVVVGSRRPAAAQGRLRYRPRTTRPSRASASTASASRSSRVAARRRRAGASPPDVAGTSPRTAPACAAARRACPTDGQTSASGHDPAARDPRQADGGAEVHERLRGAAGERVAGAALDAVDVDVPREHVLAEREVADRGGRVRADARKPRQVVGPAVRGDDRGCPVQCERPAVVAEPLPRADHVPRRCGGERLGGRPPLEPRRGSAARRVRPASAAASPRRRGSRTGRGYAATEIAARTRRTTPEAVPPRRNCMARGT